VSHNDSSIYTIRIVNLATDSHFVKETVNRFSGVGVPALIHILTDFQKISSVQLRKIKKGGQNAKKQNL
jgi:hypothetical protein